MSENSTTLVRRGRPNVRYTAISNSLINNLSLSPEARLTMIYLLSKPEDWKLQVNDIRRFLGTTEKQCGRNKAYEVIKELKASAYIIAINEIADNGRFNRITYYVFDEPHPAPEAFIAELRATSPIHEIRTSSSTKQAPDSPRPDFRETVPSPRPQKRDPEKRDLTKDGKKQTTEAPLPSPKLTPREAVTEKGWGDWNFSKLWNEWPESEQPRERGLAQKLFLQLPLSDRKAAIDFASTYRSISAHRGEPAVMIPYLRQRKFAEFEGAPEFTSDGYFRILPSTPEWDAWEVEGRKSVPPAIWAKQAALGYLLRRTRWPAKDSTPNHSGPAKSRDVQ
ncbi:hypothetical protein [uncultured Brevundimonas sp.]|uniref:hypothetical protein n=1 Tax=uncultured Brevundimonas sp. TaxID=213418 RepID=UPI00261DB178|nr:hypothetical protein [uncultured Brevundimonas sp.]